MIGAIIGDIIGSPYESDRTNIKTTDFPLFSDKSKFTDDSVMTIAVFDALDFCDGMDCLDDEDVVKFQIVDHMVEYAERYPYAGYGNQFHNWVVYDNDHKPYNSYGNGSAMRTSSIPYLVEDHAKCLELAKTVAETTHNHPEGIKGAQAITDMIWMARHGYDKATMKHEIETKYEYDLNFSLDEIRPYYSKDVTCQGSVPQAIVAYLESDSYEECVRKAVSIGGDSDTIACMAGGIAEATWGIPYEIVADGLSRLDNNLLSSVYIFIEKVYGKNTYNEVEMLVENKKKS